MTERWTPKVGDRVMVGEWGPYEVTSVALRINSSDRIRRWHLADDLNGHVATVPAFMLTLVAPESSEQRLQREIEMLQSANQLLRIENTDLRSQVDRLTDELVERHRP